MTLQEDNFEDDGPQFLPKRLSTNKSYQILPQESTNKNTSFLTRLNQKLTPLKGCFFAFLTAISWSVSNVFIKKANVLADFDQLVILNIVTIILMIPIMCYTKQNPIGISGQRFLLSCRGILSVIGLICLYTALRFIPPSDLSATGHVSIIVTALLSRIFLKEKLGIPHIFALGLTIFGVTVISKPSFLFDFKQSQNNATSTSNIAGNEFSADVLFKIGISLVLGSAVIFGSIQIIIKKLCNNNVHWSVSTIYAAYYGLPITAGISFTLYMLGYSHKNLHNELDLLPVNLAFSILSAVFGVTGSVFLNIAFQYEDATKVAIAKTSDVIISFILQLIILGIKIDLLSVIGSLAIVFGTFVVLGFKLIENKYEKSVSKKKKNSFEKFLFFKF